MGKLKFLIFLFLVLIFVMNFASASTIWEFHNFVNKYHVYKTATCNVLEKKSCPSELGWQGDKIKFNFKLKQKTADKAVFNLDVGYVINKKKIDVYVNDKRIAKKIEIKSTGRYSFEFSKSLLKSSKTNEIRIEMKDVKVGYGQPPQGFVFNSVSLENKSE